LAGKSGLYPASALEGLHACTKPRLFALLPIGWTNADAESRSVNAEARRAIVVAVVVVSPRTIITLPDDYATITPGIPALAGVVTNQSYLLKQRRAVSDLNLIGGVGARGYEGTGAGEQCQCQFSHVHLLLWSPKSERRSQSAVPTNIGSVPPTWTKLHGTNASVPGGERPFGTFKLSPVA
jgi:hypothetical protein